MNQPIGVVLAGGLGRRMGGPKATVKLNGRPLLTYALEALWQALGDVAIVAKRDSELPNLAGVTVWVEPDEPRHPLTGIVHALRCAKGRPVLVCAADLPLVSEELIRSLRWAARRSPAALVAYGNRRLQPTLGFYSPDVLDQLSDALREPAVSLSEAVSTLRPTLFVVADPRSLFNVNAPEDLLQASVLLDQRSEDER